MDINGICEAGIMKKAMIGVAATAAVACTIGVPANGQLVGTPAAKSPAPAIHAQPSSAQPSALSSLASFMQTIMQPSQVSAGKVQTTTTKTNDTGECLCKQALKLYNQGRYQEAALKYHQAALHMRQSFGHDNLYVADAYYGESLSQSAAGLADASARSYARALHIWIARSKQLSPLQAKQYISQLATKFEKIGSPELASRLNKNAERIADLMRSDPASAAGAFETVFRG